MSRARRRQAGLTLVELMLGLAISAIVIAPLAGMLTTSASAAAISGERLALEREASFVLERIAARVRATSHATLAPNSDTSTSGNWLGQYVYSLDGPALKEQGPDATRTLSDAVTGFSIVALPVAAGGTQAIQVTLTLGRGTDTTSASSTVRMGGAR